jgi:hypothetical protein
MIITGGRFTPATPPTSKITNYRWSTSPRIAGQRRLLSRA